MVYADSSIIVSCYMQDDLTSQALSTMANIVDVVAITALHRLELRNATLLAVFRSRITQSEGDAAWGDFLADYRAGGFVRHSVDWRHAFRDAFKLGSAHSVALGSRSLDILHVAAARQIGAKVFLTFDKRQRSLALAAGLQAFP
ncbi:MAG: type II toxin-antitoxin system VapC family toxin [Prosthecobacter sp.]